MCARAAGRPVPVGRLPRPCRARLRLRRARDDGAPLDATPTGSSSACAVFAAVVLVVGASRCRWQRLPAERAVAPAAACDALVALLREAQGGAPVGVRALLVLPVVWVAFIGSRRSVLLVVAALAATLMTPIVVVGAPVLPEHRVARRAAADARRRDRRPRHRVRRAHDATPRRERSAACAHARPARADAHRDRDERLRLRGPAPDRRRRSARPHRRRRRGRRAARGPRHGLPRGRGIGRAVLRPAAAAGRLRVGALPGDGRAARRRTTPTPTTGSTRRHAGRSARVRWSSCR